MKKSNTTEPFSATGSLDKSGDNNTGSRSDLPRELSRLQIAQSQLNRAIALFLGGDDYISAITLAHAADDILQDILRRQYPEVRTSHEDNVWGSRAYAVRNTNETGSGVSLRDFCTDQRTYGSGATLPFDLAAEAAELIDQAATAWWQITLTETPAMLKFKQVRYRTD